VRESLFGILAGVLDSAKVLDLFAGSGALGIEALSRGAASCTFVEQNRGAVKVIEENLKKTGLGTVNGQGKVLCREVTAHLKGETMAYDLIFADPPYSDGLTDAARDLLALKGWANYLTEGHLEFALPTCRRAGGSLLDSEDVSPWGLGHWLVRALGNL